MLFFLGITCIGSFMQTPAPPGEGVVRIEQQASGCFHHEEGLHDWVRVGDGYRWRGHELARADMEATLRAIVGARMEVPELLEEIGITPESFRAHRDEIADTVTQGTLARRRGEAELARELDRLLEWDRIAPRIRRELLGKTGGSTERRLVRASFTIDGRGVVVESKGLVPWMLPWTVTVDDASFTSEDPAIPRAMEKLVDREGPGADGLDGSSYWSGQFWSDAGFWGWSVSRELDAHLSQADAAALPGWHAASGRFKLLDARTGSAGFEPDSLFLQLESKVPAAVDRAFWYVALVDGRPAQTWGDFLVLYERADACVRQQRWLLEWKALSPERQIRLDAAGTQGHAEGMLEELVLPAWEDAGFPARPELEIQMLEKGDGVGTLYLASAVHGCLIESAHVARRRVPASGAEGGASEAAATEPSIPRHWFDDLGFSYHPGGDPPTYGRVDATGRVEVRTMAPVPLRR